MRMLVPVVLTALATLAGGCGAATSTPGAATATAGVSPAPRRAAEHDPSAPAPEPVVTACTPEGSALRFELLDLPPEIVVSTFGRNACALVPRDAGDDPPWAFVVTLSARERQMGDRRTVEERIRARAPVIERGELELLGARHPCVALHGAQLLVGEGDARYTLVDLARHTIDVDVSFHSATPEPLRAKVLAALARMRVVGLERASDARLFDPSLALCEADGVPLLVPVPEGGSHQESWPSQCMIAPEADPDTAAWSIWIGSYAAGDPDGSRLAREPDGARTWAEVALVEPRFVAEGTSSFLGAPTRWAAFDARMVESAPVRRITVTRARQGDRFVVAVLTTSPDDAGRLELLLEALAGARQP